ncbi:hypothetical protein BOTBODRAFT_35125 [Botryobasidium botryosum FD-172 SS1]|uniref:Protein kinase domain-containing protein n=1 Tax=Botryobasidium botryosum (strain FD-172 SS1) TaxID=930990 RepID=A0A067M7Z2_BOTB1|nr:hypothetical protein BOTBODRAFT_35125 [Botryobasidium botryosum FD-172 SS1]
MNDTTLVSVPRDLLKATIDLLRKDMLVLHELHREQHLEILFQLYNLSGFYPSGPPLQKWEVATMEIEPSAFGVFADVWRGMFLGRQMVALKHLKAFKDDKNAGMRRASREIDIWKGLRHPNILPFIGLATNIDTGPCLISPWIDYGDLHEYLNHGANVDRFSLIWQIANGLEYLHTSNPPVVHGDLRGANIFVSVTGNAFIGDFGSSHKLTGPISEARVYQVDPTQDYSRGMYGPSNSSNSVVWLFAWDPKWQAPELWDEHAVRTLSSDVFAFGRVVFECFANCIPWAGLSDAVVVVLTSRNQLPPPDEDAVSRGLDDHMYRLMAYCRETEPKDRPTVQLVARQLRPAAESPRREFQYFDYASDLAKSRQPDPLHLQQILLKKMTYIRKNMIYLLPSDPKEHLASLSEYYGYLKTYPTEVLEECEIDLPNEPPSGSGGFGACWQGLFLGNHKVALKCSHPHVSNQTAAERIRREIKAWKGLQHPNILPFIGSVTLKYITYLVSPWMENGDALSYVRGHPDVDCVLLVAQIAEGVKYLHTHDPVVVHGDLKATNVFISDAGEARIGDFGLSQKLIEDVSRNITTSWFAGGTLRWQAPELLLAGSLEEARPKTFSDIFALGRIIVELFTQDIPFPDLSDGTVLTLTLSGKLPPRPVEEEIIQRGLDDRMWRLMEDCCRLRPSVRPTALAAVGFLRELLSSRLAVGTSERAPAEDLESGTPSIAGTASSQDLESVYLPHVLSAQRNST